METLLTIPSRILNNTHDILKAHLSTENDAAMGPSAATITIQVIG